MKIRVRRMYCIITILNMFICGCATTNRGKTIELALAGTAAGAAFGQTRPEYKAQNSALYASMGAAIAAVAGLYIFDEEKRAEEFRTKLLELQTKVDGSFGASDLLNQQTQKVLSQGQSTFSETELPEEYQGLIRPGGWKLYEINRWVKRGTNRLVLESRLLEFTPPIIQPNSQ